MPVSAQTLRYANQGDLKSLDPYTLKETTTIAHHAHVYEGLVTRDKDLKIVPALAESWETLTPTQWRFHLRKNVKFHNGDPFTADDVIFSAARVRDPKGSNFISNVPPDAKFVKVDDNTVDVMLDSPNPILTAQWDGWFIMDKKWCEENNSVAPTPASATTPSYASLHENGTGPFIIESHQPGVKTVFKVNPNWWGKPEHNLKEIIFTPIASAATRVAALLSGEVDVIEPVPIQDIARVNSSGTATVLLQGGRRRADQEPGHARVVDALGADDCAPVVPAVEGFHAPETRPRWRQKAAGASRLPRRVRSDDGLPQ